MISALSFSSPSALPELRMAPAAPATAPKSPGPSGDFIDVMKNVAMEGTEALRQAEASAILGVQGNLPIQTVVEQVMAAERALQAGIAIRDKLVSSYLEITRMQI